ncbi:hypothetical protein BKK47_11075 [Rodentibacter mrazii]|uniref:DUF1176 domain-containing protein n=1 Tax=Rodentibacter mrazii TaxID=1908257 RepID=A0A1V3IBK6_9PAST|nr:DUF1176 domain-containing protein [Rodentibacter mrazii]OOF37414.1 hypothetical protein BKK47_11075 [Rodentibacter mrazii]
MGNWRIVLFGFYMLGQCTMVQALEGIRFQHKDWELACDNTGTCRMAGYGYSEGEESYPASLYIERKAGNEILIGLARVEEYIYDEKERDRTLQAQLWIDQRDLGIIKFDQKDDSNLEYFARLNSEQIHAIIRSLAKKSSQIEFRTPKQVWKISDQGVTAVMLKADEFQKRLDTPSAFLKKGNSHSPVLEQIDKPIVNIPKFHTDRKQIFKFDSPTGQRLLKLLKPLGGIDEGCSRLSEDDEYNFFSVYELSEGKKQVEAACELFAYNYWTLAVVMNHDLTKIEQEVSTFGEYNGYDGKGIISSEMKGRGLGDCWSIRKAAWNGKIFEPILDTDTGMCRGFAGGAWDMPTYVVDINYLP